MKTYTIEEVNAMNKKEGKPIYFTLNGMVRQYIKNEKTALGRYQMVLDNYGPHYEYLYASALYDPKYGLPKSIDMFTREHAAYCEDLHVDFLNSKDPEWKTIGKFN
jgi:hypothetical protein